jgi:nucleoside-diphosphate-sugar epimerase
MLIGVTGAHGFLGSHLWAGLRKRAYDVKVFDKRSHNLSDIASMKDFVEDVDVIFHLAGLTSSSSIQVSNEELITVNALGTFHLLEAIRRYSKNDVRLIFASTLHVYGVTDTLKHLNESEIPMPKTTYGLSKLLGEEMISCYGTQYGIKGLIFRFANIYGPGCKPYQYSVIATYMDLIRRNKPVQVIGNGVRDFIYVSDVVCALSESLKHSFTSDCVFNVCTGVPVTAREVIEALTSISGITPTVEYRNTKEPADYLVGDPRKFLENIRRMSFTDLRTGLITTVEQLRRDRATSAT